MAQNVQKYFYSIGSKFYAIKSKELWPSYMTCYSSRLSVCPQMQVHFTHFCIQWRIFPSRSSGRGHRLGRLIQRNVAETFVECVQFKLHRIIMPYYSVVISMAEQVFRNNFLKVVLLCTWGECTWYEWQLELSWNDIKWANLLLLKQQVLSNKLQETDPLTSAHDVILQQTVRLSANASPFYALLRPRSHLPLLHEWFGSSEWATHARASWWNVCGMFPKFSKFYDLFPIFR